MKYLILLAFLSCIALASKAQQNNTDSMALVKNANLFKVQQMELWKQYNAAVIRKDTVEMLKAREKNKTMTMEMQDAYRIYVVNNPSSTVAVYALATYNRIKRDVDPFEVRKLFLSLALPVRESVAGRNLGERIELACKTNIGQPSISFQQTDTAGVVVRLDAFKGKYVLLDFWASWCGPCRKENPNVLKTFNKYKDKGFTVLSISLDKKKDSWLAAINKDGMPWTHLSDLKGWENQAAILYGIHAIPQNFLIDPTGKIIAKNLRGARLEKTIGKFFSDSQIGK